MAQWKHRKPEPSTARGLCVVCKKNPQKSTGKGKYKAICSPCNKKLYSLNNRNKSVDKYKRPYRKHVKNYCEKCGFKPEHICQLDVDHIDEDHNNNSLDNLQTLCANCHRLKTFYHRKGLKA